MPPGRQWAPFTEAEMRTMHEYGDGSFCGGEVREEIAA